MQRAERTLVSRVEGLDEFEHFCSAALPENDAIGTHSQSLLEERAKRDFSKAICIGGPTDQGKEVGVFWKKLRSVFKRDDALLRCYFAQEFSQESCFAASS